MWFIEDRKLTARIGAVIAAVTLGQSAVLEVVPWVRCTETIVKEDENGELSQTW